MSASDELLIKSSIRNYSVRFVDDFSRALTGEMLANSFPVIDRNVFELYRGKLQGIAWQKRPLVVEAIETHKTLEYVRIVIGQLMDQGAKRNHRLIAIGGGIIQDIVGFVSSILFRGVEWVFCPTTLLAQSDSCIGSKTSINVGDFKNQLGTFCPPTQIVLDTGFLKTLAIADVKSGLGEIIKVHFLDGEESLEHLASSYEPALSDPAVMKDLLTRSLIIKKGFIEKDEFDKDYRNLLNYGHTFGHAIESMTSYRVPHGQAVTIGMDIANYISLRRGALTQASYDRMKEVLLKNYPDYSISRPQTTAFLAALAKDKKNVDDNLTAILTEGPGRMQKAKVPFDELRKIVGDFITAHE